MPKLKTQKKRDLIEHLVGNCDCDQDPLFSEDDIDVLEKMDLEKLETLAHNTNEVDEEMSADDEEHDPEDMELKKKKRKAKRLMNTKDSDYSEEGEETVSNKIREEDLPDEWREDLKLVRNMRRQKKDQLIAKITENQDEGSGYSEDELEAMDLDSLEKIVGLVKNVQKNYKPATRRVKRVGGHAEPTKNTEKLGAPIPVNRLF